MSYNENVLYDGIRYTQQDSDVMFDIAETAIKYAVRDVNRESLPYIRTFYGIKFRHTWPVPEDVCIEDIAWSLSQLCRFAGHLKYFYSVAEHCVRVSYFCDQADALEGLLHDASETYCVDVPRPLKRAPGMEIYRLYEKRIAAVIEQHFNLRPEPQSVMDADLRILSTERRDLFWRDSSWAVNKGEYGTPYPEKIEPWTPEEARRRFLMRYYELTGVNKFYEKYHQTEEAAS